MTIGERREELARMSFHKLIRMFRRVVKETTNNDWVDRRKRADLMQAIINYEISIGGRM